MTAHRGRESVHASLRTLTEPDSTFVIASLLMSLTVWWAGWRGSDWPAQLFRVELFDQSGFTVWNPYWYAGHHTPAYSVLFPPIADFVGIGTIAIVSTVASIVLFGRLARAHLASGATPMLAVFCVGMLANLAIGRLPFALGAAFALAALVAHDHRRPVVATIAAVLASLSSPLAGAFLALAVAAWAGTEMRERARRAAPIALGALIPVLLFFAVFPQGGWFPYRGDEFLGTLALAGAIYLLAPREWREIRVGAVLVMVSAVPLFVIPNAIGGNLVRLVAILGIPIAAAVLWARWRWLVLLVVPLTIWQIGPAASAVRAPAEPSADAAYYEPMVDALTEITGGLPIRIEIPFTAAHWEAAYAGPHLMLARGWERQLDREHNAELYADDLGHAAYRGWLLDNAVSYVALPNVELDPGSVREAELILERPDYLRFAWSDANWRVFEVVDPAPLMSPAGYLTRVEPDEIQLYVPEAGTYQLRFQYSGHLSVSEGLGCVSETADGWTQLDLTRAGYVRLSTGVTGGDSCQTIDEVG